MAKSSHQICSNFLVSANSRTCGWPRGEGTQDQLSKWDIKQTNEQLFQMAQARPDSQVSLGAEYKHHRLKACHARQVHLIYDVNNSQGQVQGRRAAKSK